MATATLSTRKIQYPSSDGKPMAETGFHVANLTDTLSLLVDYFKHRRDVFVNGNIFIYYDEGEPKKRLSPDIFVVYGVSNVQRNNYKVWEEGKYPDLIIEFTSAKTRKNDMVKKLAIYQDLWKVSEYFLFDPRTDYLKHSPTGYRLVEGVYRPIESQNGRVPSEVLGFTLERNGHDLLFRDAKTGVPIRRESEVKLAEAEREIEFLKQQIAKLSSHSKNGH